MKILKSTLLIAVILITTSELKAQETNFVKQNNDTTLYIPKSIVVPEVKDKQVVTDGLFSNCEWDDALDFLVKDNYTIYLMADSDILYIGLGFPKPMGVCVCEIRITSNEKEIFLLHVSGGLGEGVSGFPATTQFDLHNNKYWESNPTKVDSLKKEEWIADGQPLDKYDDIYEKREGLEFKINRKKFTNNSLKFTIGWIRVEVKGTEINKNIYNYPENASLKNDNNWIELFLPVTKNQN